VADNARRLLLFFFLMSAKLITIQRPKDGWNDKERYEFLMRLDERSELEVSDWEAEFIESVTEGYEQYHSFTDKQRKVIDKMADKYGL